MAITHADLAVRRNWRRWNTDISSKLGLFFMVFSVICGLAAFIFCLSAEASKSEVGLLRQGNKSNGAAYQCTYSGSGRTALSFIVAAFLLLALAMFAQHAYLLLAVAGPSPPALIAWTIPAQPRPTSSGSLVRQACCLFLTTWICFAIAEVILLVGIGVESGHLINWSQPRLTCHAVPPGLYAVAGVFSLLTVFLGVGLYLTALRAQRMQNDHDHHGHGGTLPPPYPPQDHHFDSTAPQGGPTTMPGQEANNGLPQDKYPTSL